MRKFSYVLVSLLVLLMLSGCTSSNKDYSIGNYEYNYVTCESGYANLYNEPIKSWKEDGDYGIEVTLENGNNLSLNAFKCYLSKNTVE